MRLFFEAGSEATRSDRLLWLARRQRPHGGLSNGGTVVSSDGTKLLLTILVVAGIVHL